MRTSWQSPVGHWEQTVSQVQGVPAVERGVRFSGDAHEGLRHTLYVLTGCVGVVEHDVVGIDEAQGEEPGLAVLVEGLAFAAEPALGGGGGELVVVVSAQGHADDKEVKKVSGE